MTLPKDASKNRSDVQTGSTKDGEGVLEENRNAPEASDRFGEPLDPAQLIRIESVHRGFLYQHLYAAACLLSCGRAEGNTILIERDEDVELVRPADRYYIQVKTRQRPLQIADVEGALDRFEELRRAHVDESRKGRPLFVIVANVEPGRELRRRLGKADWPDDVSLITPQGTAHNPLPPAWSDIDAAIAWCIGAAQSIPFGTLAPETLVWKLAAKVQHAASRAREAVFEAAGMSALFEQLLIQLQDFPDPPEHYRPQMHEPALVSEAAVRLLVGFSGAGKTAWASQAALHSPDAVIYYDVGDMPAASVASGIARELAARFAGGRAQQLGGGTFAESGGIDILRVCAAQLKHDGLVVTVVCDNVHRMGADAIRTIVEACPNLRFLFIAQPWDGQALVEAHFGIRAERLAGWSYDDIAAEFNRQQAPASVETVKRISRITGGLPLYVRSAARLAVAQYGADAEAMCDAVDARTHAEATAQEIILEQSFGRLSKEAQEGAALLCLSDVALTNSEAIEVLGVILSSPAAAAQSLRHLKRASMIVGFQGDRIGLHDALRPVAGDKLATFSPDLHQAALRRLHVVLIKSLHMERSIPRLNAIFRLLPKIGETNALVDLATSEMFHEQGDQRTLWRELENAANDPVGTPYDRYWAHDALAYWESRDGGRPSQSRLVAMRDLIDQGELGVREQLGLCFKEMAAAGSDGQREAVEAAFQRGVSVVKAGSVEGRLLRYNRLIAFHRLGDHREILRQIEPLIQEYYKVIGLREADVFMKSNAALQALLPRPIDTEDLKRLADALALWCHARVAVDEPPLLRRIHALKFYVLANAGRSAAGTGQEAVDDFLQIKADPIGARQTMEQHVLPLLAAFQLTDMIVPIRSHYAIVLAWCRDFTEARRELRALAEYGGTPDQRAMVEERAEFVEAIAAGRVHLKRQAPPPNALRLIPGALPVGRRKIGRNDPCPCGSGRKFKRCHGTM
ncbi:SEC-C metal-binding domain-containing protein [Bradyrhizobium japonicum]|uniref:SEC-C metal-binding domain-containing protein n=2 Tax=Bradyrhizobium japonicum TaxID=375 RepID=UPI003518663B